MKTALSIIVPIYKIEETLLRTCINSLLKQTVDNFEIILINDGSPDCIFRRIPVQHFR